jgi:hypothetical protein
MAEIIEPKLMDIHRSVQSHLPPDWEFKFPLHIPHVMLMGGQNPFFIIITNQLVQPEDEEGVTTLKLISREPVFPDWQIGLWRDSDTLSEILGLNNIERSYFGMHFAEYIWEEFGMGGSRLSRRKDNHEMIEETMDTFLADIPNREDNSPRENVWRTNLKAASQRFGRYLGQKDWNPGLLSWVNFTAGQIREFRPDYDLEDAEEVFVPYPETGNHRPLGAILSDFRKLITDRYKKLEAESLGPKTT